MRAITRASIHRAAGQHPREDPSVVIIQREITRAGPEEPRVALQVPRISGLGLFFRCLPCRPSARATGATLAADIVFRR
jgi:hypothetical protein